MTGPIRSMAIAGPKKEPFLARVKARPHLGPDSRTLISSLTDPLERESHGEPRFPW
jgi:hypothetical protein